MLKNWYFLLCLKTCTSPVQDVGPKGLEINEEGEEMVLKKNLVMMMM